MLTIASEAAQHLKLLMPGGAVGPTGILGRLSRLIVEPRSRGKRIGIGVMCTAIAALFRIAIDPYVAVHAPWQPFSFAVLMAALVSGRLGATTTILLSAVVGEYLMPSFGPPELQYLSRFASVTLFTATSACIALVASGVRQLVLDAVAREGELRTIQERTRVALDVGRVGTWYVNLDTQEAHWNAGHFEALGLDPTATQASIDLWLACVHPDDRDRVNQAWRASLIGGAPYESEYRIVWPNGVVRWMRARGRLMRDAAGTPRADVGALVDITAWKEGMESQEALRVSEERYRMALRGSSVAVWECDADLRFTFVDNALEPVTDREVILGKRDDEILPPESVREMMAIKRRVFASGRGERHELCVYVKSQAHYFDYVVEPIVDHERKVVGLRGVAVDVTERIEKQHALTDAARRKDEFLAMLAHELRNPLAPIRNAVELLRLLGSSDDRAQRARDVIDRQVTHMARLVDDLLDASRITRGKIELQKTIVALGDVVAEASESARPWVTQHEHSLSVTLGSEPILVEGDRARLIQVVANLLTNAAKFTPHGGHITISAFRSDAGEAVLQVRDTGIGIPRDRQTIIFEMFHQEETSLARTQGGLGIGLTLVKRLVELHSGRVEVRSDGRGTGSEFTVVFPLAHTTAAPSPGRPGTLPVATSMPVRVLVVEDNADAAESLKMLLDLAGHDVRVVASGLDALRTLDDFEPQIAFIDLGLPEMNGFELARRFRQDRRAADAKLIAITGYGREEDKAAVMRAGFDRHLVKPVDIDTVKGVIGSMVGGHPLSAHVSKMLH